MPHQNVTISDPYVITVDYSRKLDQFRDAGGYDHITWGNPHPDVLLVQGEGVQTRTCRLVHFTEMPDEEERLEVLEQEGLHLPLIEDGLSFGEQHPDLQREGPIVAHDTNLIRGLIRHGGISGGDDFCAWLFMVGEVFLDGDATTRTLGGRWNDTQRMERASRAVRERRAHPAHARDVAWASLASDARTRYLVVEGREPEPQRQAIPATRTEGQSWHDALAATGIRVINSFVSPDNFPLENAPGSQSGSYHLDTIPLERGMTITQALAELASSDYARPSFGDALAYARGFLDAGRSRPIVVPCNPWVYQEDRSGVPGRPFVVLLHGYVHERYLELLAEAEKAHGRLQMLVRIPNS